MLAITLQNKQFCLYGGKKNMQKEIYRDSSDGFEKKKLIQLLEETHIC